MQLLIILFSIFALCQPKPYASPNGALRPSLMKGGEQYISGGTDAEPGEFPWQLSVQLLSTTWSHTFGAILLNANYGLIAATCVDTIITNTVRVVAGLHQQSDLTGTQAVDISGIKQHEAFNVGDMPYANDIAILTFATPIIIGGNVQPAPLPADDSNSYVGYTCIITGWGSTGLSNPDALQKASIQVLSNTECAAIYETTIPGNNVTDGQVCVFDPTQIVGVCTGDTGSPLNCPDGVTRVVGIESWKIIDGTDNCQQIRPAIYTRISYYLEWIAANTP